jgi:hypothetical protein
MRRVTGSGCGLTVHHGWGREIHKSSAHNEDLTVHIRHLLAAASILRKGHAECGTGFAPGIRTEEASRPASGKWRAY